MRRRAASRRRVTRTGCALLLGGALGLSWTSVTPTAAVASCAPPDQFDTCSVAIQTLLTSAKNLVLPNPNCTSSGSSSPCPVGTVLFVANDPSHTVTVPGTTPAALGCETTTACNYDRWSDNGVGSFVRVDAGAAMSVGKIPAEGITTSNPDGTSPVQFAPTGLLAGTSPWVQPYPGTLMSASNPMAPTAVLRRIEAWPGGYEEKDIISKVAVGAPVVLTQAITLPASWSVNLDADNVVVIFNNLQEPVGEVTAPSVTDNGGAPVPFAVTLVGDVLAVRIDASRAQLPISFDPYTYRNGRISNGGYTWTQTTDRGATGIAHTHVIADSCTAFGCEYEIDARYTVALKQGTNGLNSFGTQTSLTVTQAGGRPPGYADGFRLYVKFHCRVNLTDDYDYFCDQPQGPTPAGADPPYEQQFDGYPTSKTVGPVPQYLPPAATDPKHHYFYEVTILPLPPEDPGTPPNDHNRYRTYDISCDTIRNKGAQECYYDESRPTGTGH